MCMCFGPGTYNNKKPANSKEYEKLSTDSSKTKQFKEFKTVYFMCDQVKYSDKTGRVNYIRFVQIPNLFTPTPTP